MSDRHPVYADLAKGEKLYACIEKLEKPLVKLQTLADRQVEAVWRQFFGLFLR